MTVPSWGVLDDTDSGWFGPKAMAKMPHFAEDFVCDPAKPHYGFTSRTRRRRLRHRPELRAAADPVRPADREEPDDPVDARGDARRGHRHAAVLHPPRAADRRRQDE